MRIGIDVSTWSNGRGFGRFTRELVTAMIEYGHPFRDERGGERNIRGDRDVARLRGGFDVPVGNVRPAVDAHAADKRVAGRYLHPLVSDEDRRQREPLGGAEDDVLHVARRGVGVDPEFHRRKLGT